MLLGVGLKVFKWCNENLVPRHWLVLLILSNEHMSRSRLPKFVFCLSCHCSQIKTQSGTAVPARTSAYDLPLARITYQNPFYVFAFFVIKYNQVCVSQPEQDLQVIFMNGNDIQTNYYAQLSQSKLWKVLNPISILLKQN